MEWREDMGKIWKHLTTAGMTAAGAAGMMGNMYGESGCVANRVEVLCLQRLAELGKHYTDATYTAFVDDGTISRACFVHPLPGKQYGYGLCQWTSPGRKGALYDFAKTRKTSVGNLEMQIDFLIEELRKNYTGVWNVLTETGSIATASDCVLTKFEMPADISEAVKATRRAFAQAFCDEYGGKGMTEAQAIDKLISFAAGEVGYLEKSSDESLYDKTVNAGPGNCTKYGKEMHFLQPANMDYPAAWCDAFVDWCFFKVFGAETARKMLCGDFDDYTPISARYYQNAGRWSQNPRRGAQIFFRNASGICHTGIVRRVSDDKVYTVEGNASNAVREREYSRSDSTIAGYGMPRYELVATDGQKYTGTCNATARQLIKGDYGPAVKALQALLNLYGYRGKDGKVLTVDGQFGDNTEHAVTACQNAAGMTGINFGTVSTLTWNVLLR